MKDTTETTYYTSRRKAYNSIGWVWYNQIMSAEMQNIHGFTESTIKLSFKTM